VKRISTKEGATDDPPAFEEMLRTPPVFFMFLSYLIDQLATENLFFLQFVRIYRMMKRPQQEIDNFGRRIMCIFCLPGAPSEVNISAETRSSLCQAYLQPCIHRGSSPLGSSVYTPTLFDTAYSEIRGLLTQPFTSWVATNEWKKRDILNSMRRLRPPSFSTVLGDPTLCSLFHNFLRERVDEGSEEIDSFLFCVDCEKFRATALGQNQQTTVVEDQGRPRKMSDASEVTFSTSAPEGLDTIEFSNNSDDERKSVRSRRCSEAVKPTDKDEDLIMGTSESVNLEKLARSIIKKHKLSKKSKQLSYRLYLSAQFDRHTSVWVKNDLFIQWQKSKQWADVSFKDYVTLKQSKTTTGMIEFPSLSAAIVSLIEDPHRSGNGLGTLLKYLMNYSSYPKDLEFMEAVLKFRKKFGDSPDKNVEKKIDKNEMVDAASLLFNTFLAPVNVVEVSPHSPCPQFLTNPLAASPRGSSLSPSPHGSPMITPSVSESVEVPLVSLDNTIVNELRAILWSSAKTKVHPDMFRRAATYVFHRAQNTWYRELVGCYLWVGRDYQNGTPSTDRVDSYFGDFSVIEDVIESQPPVFLFDDILQNNTLYTRFMAVVPSTRKSILDTLDRISAFRMRPVQTLREARSLRSVIKDTESDNIVVRKLIKNMKSYLDLETVAAPFQDDGNSTPPTEGTALINSSIFDFIRSSFYRQLLAECGDKVVIPRSSRQAIEYVKELNFFKYVDPLHEIEISLVTKQLQSQGPATSGSGNSSKSNSTGNGVRTPLLSSMTMPTVVLDMNPADQDDSGIINVPGKKPGFLNFLRQKKPHSPLVRHVRTPGSVDSSSLRSPDVSCYHSPKDSTSGVSSMVMTMPSFDEVLGSTYFRKMLTDYYFGRVDEDQANAWDDLTRFYEKFSKVDDYTLSRSQEAAVKHAKNVIQSNRQFLSTYAEDLEEYLSSNQTMTVTANFFRKAEKNLFSKAYDAFVQYLIQKGWKIVPVAVSTDDDLMFM